MAIKIITRTTMDDEKLKRHHGMRIRTFIVQFALQTIAMEPTA